MEQNRMEKIVALAKRRGFIFPGSEIYGGLAGTWDYGPLGVELKNNIKKEWWKMFVHGRDDIYGIDSAILMNRKVWEASGHLKNFSDPMVDCKKCQSRFRADNLLTQLGKTGAKGLSAQQLADKIKSGSDIICPECGAREWTDVKSFNMMFKTYAGPVDDHAAEIFLRPETAQGMFANFKNVLDSMHPKLPFGIAQVGKAFRNEITPGNFIFRTREFEQMEIEYFVRSEGWEDTFRNWLKEIHTWLTLLGLDGKVSEREVPEEERAHYSRRTIDIDFDFPFGREELYGIACRSDFDLKNHTAASGVELVYYDEATKEKFIPYVIEPTFGADRTALALFTAHYAEEEDKKGEKRVILKFPPSLAPYKVAVFPLVANKPQLVEKARAIFDSLHTTLRAVFDDRGNIGKRYYAQDEIGTPWCLTIDYQTLEDDTVTVRTRDTAEQERIAVQELGGYFEKKLAGLYRHNTIE